MNCKMTWEPTFGKEKQTEMFREFNDKYLGRYSGKDRVLISLNLENGVGHYFNPMQLYQIYSYLNLFKSEDDIYYGYFKKLAENFDINCNILDVASGAIPAFGLIISGKQMELPNARGSITMCDPAIVLDTLKNENMTIVRDKFKKDDVFNYDLITGIMPCGVTRDIIESACQYNKDFFIGLCGCPQEDDIFDNGKSSIENNIDFASDMCSKYNRELIVENLDYYFTANKPIIYSKKCR